MKNLNELLKSGKVVQFDNETELTMDNDAYYLAQCTFTNERLNTLRNGYKISFNGATAFSSNNFELFEEKLSQMKRQYNLQLKSW